MNSKTSGLATKLLLKHFASHGLNEGFNYEIRDYDELQIWIMWLYDGYNYAYHLVLKEMNGWI